VEISDCGRIELLPDELLSLRTPSAKDYEISAKDWGFYATPSINGRLKKAGFKTALVKNPQGKYFVMVVEEDKLNDFEAYLARDGQKLLEWLDERP